ncbi:MAG: hypothetical protein O7H41_10120 [Planctomycetota bacterium]|nr:hypothetical protein [Planctomycetota bacterium]
MTMDLAQEDARIVDRLFAEHGAKRVNDVEIKFLCPLHDDKKSLSGTWNTQKHTGHCFGCAGTWGVLRMLEILGMEPQNSKGGGGAILIARYIYEDCDVNGNWKTVYEMRKYRPGFHNDPKGNYPFHPCPESKYEDGFTVGLGGKKERCSCARVPTVLYRSRELAAAAPSEIVFIPEGEKDVDSVQRLGLVATCNWGGAGKWKANKQGREWANQMKGRCVVLLNDNDEPGRNHVQQVASALHGIVREIRLLDLSKSYQLKKGGDVSDAIGLGLTKEKLLELAEKAPPLVGTDPTFTDPKAGDGRPMITAGDEDYLYLIPDARKALMRWNNPPSLFLHGDRVAETRAGADGQVAIHSVSVPGLRSILGEAVSWYRMKGEVQKPAKPPKDVAESIRDRPLDTFPYLLRLVTAPVFAKSGRLVTESGYDPETRIFLDLAGLKLPAVPEKPDKDEIAAALELLLDELLEGFPFVADADKANTIGLSLLPFAREMIDGPTPLHLIEKPLAGSGATLIAQVVSIIATGQLPAILTEGHSEDEWRKRLTSVLLEGAEILTVDNLRDKLDSPALAGILTSSRYQDRILGGSTMAHLSVRCVFIATGNNPSVSNEISRRCVSIRIDPKVAQPWLRKDEEFVHPKLVAWAQKNRGRLVTALLTLIRAWVAAGHPTGTLSLGSFESWSDVIGGILKFAGIEGFLANRERFYGRADRDTAAWEAFIAAWWEKHGANPVGVKDLFELENDFELGRGNGKSQKTKLGTFLRGAVDRRFTLEDGLRVKVENAGKAQRAAQYVLTEMIEGAVEDGNGSPSPARSPEPEKQLNLAATGTPKGPRTDVLDDDEIPF